MLSSAPVRTLASLLALAFVGCVSDPSGDTDAAGEVIVGAQTVSEDSTENNESVDLGGAEIVLDRWEGDYPEMVERRLIRALVVPSKTHYFHDGARPMGIAYEALQQLEKAINEQVGTRTLKVNMAIIPVSRDQIIPYLEAGKADLAVANLTITPARKERVDFSVPVYKGAREVVVTGPNAPELETIDDLVGTEIWVRPSSSYMESLMAIDSARRVQGKKPLTIFGADEYLESEDLLEMVAAGLVPATVVDEHIASFWTQIFDSLVIHEDLAVRSGGEIGWMMRKGTPELKQVVDTFVSKNKQGTLFGNILLRRYLKSTKWAKNSLADTDLERFRQVRTLFRHYGEKYELDWLLIAAQAYQESGLDHSVVSAVGAIGIMQVMRPTATNPPISIADFAQLEPNIHAGVKYMRHVIDTYFADETIEPLDRMLFGFAAYNAGPTRISRLRSKAAERGLDPDRWFNNVERVVAETVGREPVQYVSNIMKYYIAYRMLEEREVRQGSAVR